MHVVAPFLMLYFINSEDGVHYMEVAGAGDNQVKKTVEVLMFGGILSKCLTRNKKMDGCICCLHRCRQILNFMASYLRRISLEYLTFQRVVDITYYVGWWYENWFVPRLNSNTLR
jgi:hypothetical protein